ncbi:MAG: PhoP regulatory network YrbL family protein [Desulfobulbaceae bacterium]|jgi:hypothetical protein|nr:PhoP regulatory network YrbL family protein [Desulfobulbaceae bacterium]
MPTGTILELTPDGEIGHGKTRRCFVHPHNPNILIKIAGKRAQDTPPHNLLEARYYGEIRAKHGQISWIAQVYGFVDTNIGKGLMVEAIRNADGGLARPLADLLDNSDRIRHWDRQKVYEAVKALVERLLPLDLRLFDLNFG